MVERVGGVDWSGMKSGDAEGDETRKIEKRKMGPERGGPVAGAVRDARGCIMDRRRCAPLEWCGDVTGGMAMDVA